MLIELFMTICLATTLNCTDISVTRNVLGKNIFAEATHNGSGKYRIIFAESTRYCNLNEEELMVHEVAHLLTFEVNPTNDTHNTEYRNICKELATHFDLSTRKVCSK